MRSKSNLAIRRLALLGAATAVVLPAVAFAQAATAPADEESGAQRDADQRDKEIIVTGTLVRGIAPPGASPVTVSAKDIQATGATTVAQVLQTIPQLGSFGTLQAPLANSPEVTTNRPNLRSLPGFNNGGGSTTLVLMDGHRVVGMGNNSTNPDPDIIPPGVIERVEIVPDGGSALYGSDAVAGVINFITRKRFDGVKVDASYGVADNYYRYDANVTAGKDWGSGSLFVSYNYAKSDSLIGLDRDYIKQFPGASGAGRGLTSLTCSPGNIETLAGAFGTPAGRVIGLPAGTATAPNQCDSSDLATIYPAAKRHSVFAGLTQQLSSAITFNLTGFYTNRKTQIDNGPLTFAQLLVPQPLTAALQARGVPAVSSPFSTVRFGGFGPAGPFFVPNSPNTIDLVQQVDGVFPGVISRANVELATYGFNPSVTVDLGRNFRLKVQGGYGESTSRFTSGNFSQKGFENAVTAGLFNPFDPATASADVVSAITSTNIFYRTRQNQHNVKAVVDGDLFALPAGAVKIAVGAEYSKENYITQSGTGVAGFEVSGFAGRTINGTAVLPAVPPVARFDVQRSIKSVFGEVVAPVFGGDDSPSLTVSAAGRYDDYSDVGDTFNPRFGATFKPVPWVQLRAAWGKSFNAPSLADASNADITTAFVLTGAAASFFAPPASLVGTGPGQFPAYTGGLIVALRGNAPGIRPQFAKTWTAGFDIQPPFVPGLNVGVSYYNIKYNNLIGLAPFQTPPLLYANFANLITLSPSQPLIDSAIAAANVINGPTPVTASTVYAFFDARKRNLGDFKLDGLDLKLNYQRETGFGSVFVNANGTYELNREQSNTPGAAFFDVLRANTNRFRIRTSGGLQVGSVLGQITWNHLSGYKLDPIVGFAPQSRVASFDTFDLFFSIAVPSIGIGKEMAITLNVDNVFDRAPPQFRGVSSVAGQNGIQNGNTIGRFGRIGISTKF